MVNKFVGIRLNEDIMQKVELYMKKTDTLTQNEAVLRLLNAGYDALMQEHGTDTDNSENEDTGDSDKEEHHLYGFRALRNL